MRSKNVMLLCVVLLPACASVGTPAVDPDIVYMPGAGGAAGARNLSLPPMTFDELLNCAYKVRDLNQQDSDLDAANKRNDSSRLLLQQQGDGLDGERSRVNTRDGKAVDDYNRRLDAYQAAVKTFNAELDKYNAAIDARNLVRNTFNAQCANRPYRRSDYAKIPASLRAVIDANSKSGG